MEGQFVIQTPRFTVRKIDPNRDDLAAYLSWLRNTLSNPFIESARSTYTESEIADYITSKNCKKDALLLGIYSKATDHVGNIKFEPIVKKSQTAVMGILVGDESWRRKGVASEVFAACVPVLNSEFGITEFHLGVNPENIAAINLYFRLGFSLDVTNSTPEKLSMSYRLNPAI